MSEHAGADRVYRLMYRSHSRMPAETAKVDLGHLFSAARSANKAQGITGALLITRDTFAQVLEGPEDAVRALYATISADPRHDEVVLLSSGVAPREFARWSMAEIRDEGELALIAHTDGIAGAASRRLEPGQRDVLDQMRASVGRTRLS